MLWTRTRHWLGRWRRRLRGTRGARATSPSVRAAVPVAPVPVEPVPAAPLTGPSLARHRAFLPKGQHRRVALLIGDRTPAEVGALLWECRADRVLVCGTGDDPADPAYAWRTAGSVADLHAALRELGPVDLVVDLLPDTETWADAFPTLFFHLRPAGVYALGQARATGGPPARAAEYVRRTWQRSADAPISDPALDRTGIDPTLRIDEPAAAAAARLEDELQAACARIVVERHWLLVQQRTAFVLRPGEHEIDRLLPLRDVGVSVRTLDRRPGGVLDCRGTVVHHGNRAPIINLDLTMRFPELRVRHYAGRTAMASNQLLTADATVLPASYRYPDQRHNPRVTAVGADFGRVGRRFRPRTTLAGDHYHLDGWNPGHFGHTMTEVVSRLWGFHQAKQQFPDLKALFRLRFPGERDPTLELALFQAYGIDPADVVWVSEPVWLESVVTATAMWQNERPFFVHPDLTEVWSRLRSSLVAPVADPPRRIFLSRRPGLINRSCRNAEVVEAIFAAAGFHIVHPEELPFADQATLFGHAEVIAGFAGSALFNLLFAGQVRTLIVIGHEGYTARYEHLFTMLLGCTTHYFWNPPDVAHPPGGWSREAYYSSWAFDEERNGPELRSLLAGLD